MSATVPVSRYLCLHYSACSCIWIMWPPVMLALLCQQWHYHYGAGKGIGITLTATADNAVMVSASNCIGVMAPAINIAAKLMILKYVYWNAYVVMSMLPKMPWYWYCDTSTGNAANANNDVMTSLDFDVLLMYIIIMITLSLLAPQFWCHDVGTTIGITALLLVLA